MIVYVVIRESYRDPEAHVFETEALAYEYANRRGGIVEECPVGDRTYLDALLKRDRF